MNGSFLKQFFDQRGFKDIKPNDELDVLCPFEHDKGYEKRPSAHVNIKKGTFHCKTCYAEGRFSNGGLSEAGFVAEYYGMNYHEAVIFLSAQGKDLDHDDSHVGTIDLLLGCQEKMEYLEARGITKELVEEYKLGYDGSGILYPVYINGIMLDKRTYNTSPQGNEAKIKSIKGAKPLLFPYDKWIAKLEDAPFTLLTAGENDTLLARKYGYNAVESTMGEGSFPKIFLRLFKGKKVIICYDCDEAGREASKSIAFLLRETGAEVWIADLGLKGTKEDKDITDFFIKHEYSKDNFEAKLGEATKFTDEEYVEIKNKTYPLVDLWDVPEGRNSGKRLSSRVIMMGKFSTPMETPSAIQYECHYASKGEDENCNGCPFKEESEKWWVLDDDHLKDVLYLAEVNEAPQNKQIDKLLYRNPSCPSPPRHHVRERKHVTKVIFSPDVDTESELSGFRAAEQHAYVIGLNLEDGQRYRVFFKRYAHPNDKQKIVMIVDRVEDSDNSTSMFRITPDILAELTQFQGHPEEVMEKRFELAKEVVGTFAHDMVVASTNIMFHSPLEFRYGGSYEKGYPEALIIGESRTGKTKTAKRLENFYRLGNFTAVRNASTAGLLGGADRLPSGEFRISWGKIPLNHKGLIVLDEMSGISKDVMATLTDMRSEGVALIDKIVKGKAPARTRMLWISNPRTNHDGNSKGIDEYQNGIRIVLDLVGSDEDIARFDFVYILPADDDLIPPRFEDEEIEKSLANRIDYLPYHHLIQWAWSRKSNQVKFDKAIDRYIWSVAQQLNDKYRTKVKLLGPEAHLKLARIAVSCAVMCFSHDGTGETILVKKEHVDWAESFLLKCYDNEVFQLARYVEQERKLTTLTDEVIIETAKLLKKYPVVIKLLLEQEECPHYNLKTMSGISEEEYKYLTSTMYNIGLLTSTTRGVSATKRLKRALTAIQKNEIPKTKFKTMDDKPKSFSDKINLN